MSHTTQVAKILVTDAYRGSAVSIIRSLGKQGWHVLATDSKPASPGFRSRYAAEHALYPDPETHPKEFVDTILELVQTKQINLIIPVTDATILPLVQARSQFDGLCLLAIPEAETLQIVTDKLKTFDVAQELGIPIPGTRLVNTVDEALEVAANFSWPIVLKPQQSRVYRNQGHIESFQVSYAINPEDLATRMAEFEGHCAVLLQEYCKGIGYGVEILMWDGHVLNAFQHKRLREVPITGGASSFRESVPLDKEMYEYSVELLKSIDWVGLAMVEFKGTDDGPRLMEVNGRVWGSLPLAIYSGVDFPAQLVKAYLQTSEIKTTQPDTNYQLGVRARNLELDVVWILSVLAGIKRYPFLEVPDRKEAIGAILGLFNPIYKMDMQSWTDPLPGLAEIPNIVKKIWQKFKERNS